MSRPMSTPIELRFRYEQIDYVRAVRLHLSKRMRLRLDLAVAVALGMTGLAFLVTEGVTWPAVAATSSAVVFLCLLGLAHFVMPVVAFWQQPKLHEKYLLRFADEGIHFKTASIDSTVEWKLYRELLSNEHTHLLVYGTNGFTAVPRRTFTSPEQDQRFVELVRAAIPGGR